MSAIKKLFRLIYIQYILLKHGLDRIVWATPLFAPFSVLIIFFPWRWFRKKSAPTGESIRLALEELGPIFVKFGQLLSPDKDQTCDDPGIPGRCGCQQKVSLAVALYESDFPTNLSFVCCFRDVVIENPSQSQSRKLSYPETAMGSRSQRYLAVSVTKNHFVK